MNFIIPDNKREFDYVGLNVSKDNSEFVFPCRYISKASSSELKREEARKIISLIKSAFTQYNFGDAREEDQRFHSMSWIIRDFLENGYYYDRESTVSVRETGKICWNKTIKKNQILYDNGNIIYKDFYRFKNVINHNALFVEIHKCVLEISVSQIGFLYGLSHSDPSKFKADANDLTFMLHILEKELSNTYNDRRRTLIEQMITVLTGARGASSMLSLCAKDFEFEYVFEFLVNSIFGTENVKDYYNQASYIIDGRQSYASKMRPDTIMRKSSDPDVTDFYVLDAKYYNYGYTGNVRDLPQSSSITKQISYNYYLKDKHGGNFYSIFLLPFSRERDGDAIQYVGYAKNEEGKPSNESRIAVCLVDLKTLVDSYFGLGESKEALREQLSTLVLSQCFDSH